MPLTCTDRHSQTVRKASCRALNSGLHSSCRFTTKRKEHTTRVGFKPQRGSCCLHIPDSPCMQSAGRRKYVNILELVLIRATRLSSWASPWTCGDCVSADPSQQLQPCPRHARLANAKEAFPVSYLYPSRKFSEPSCSQTETQIQQAM